MSQPLVLEQVQLSTTAKGTSKPDEESGAPVGKGVVTLTHTHTLSTRPRRSWHIFRVCILMSILSVLGIAALVASNQMSGTPDTYTCNAWRQTMDCDPDGAREPDQDLSCDHVISDRVSGYCECQDSATLELVSIFKVSCGHLLGGTCKEKCDAYK